MLPEYKVLRSRPFRDLLRRVAEEYGCSLRTCLRRLVDEGHNATEIAKLLGIDRQRLYEYARAVDWQFMTTTSLVDLRAQRDLEQQRRVLAEAGALADELEADGLLPGEDEQVAAEEAADDDEEAAARAVA